MNIMFIYATGAMLSWYSLLKYKSFKTGIHMNKLLASLLFILSYSAMACTDADHLHEGVSLNEIVSTPLTASSSAPASEPNSSVQITNKVSDAVIASEPSVEKVKFPAAAAAPTVEYFGASVVDTAPMAKFEISDTPVKETKAEVKSESIALKVVNENKTEEATTTTVGDLTAPSRMKNDSSTSSPLVAAVPVEVIYVSTIDPNAIRKVLRDHIPKFRYCYQKELDVAKNSEGFEGVINLRFFIASAGKVTRSEVTSDVIISEKVPECIKNVLQGIQFTEPKNGGTVEVNQPMNLYSKRI